MYRASRDKPGIRSGGRISIVFPANISRIGRQAIQLANGPRSVGNDCPSNRKPGAKSPCSKGSLPALPMRIGGDAGLSQRLVRDFTTIRCQADLMSNGTIAGHRRQIAAQCGDRFQGRACPASIASDNARMPRPPNMKQILACNVGGHNGLQTPVGAPWYVPQPGATRDGERHPLGSL